MYESKGLQLIINNAPAICAVANDPQIAACCSDLSCVGPANTKAAAADIIIGVANDCDTVSKSCTRDIAIEVLNVE